MTITVHVDVSTFEGQAIIRELENHKTVVVIETAGKKKEELIPPITYLWKRPMKPRTINFNIIMVLFLTSISNYLRDIYSFN